MQDVIGLSIFCYDSPIGEIEIVTEGNNLLRTALGEDPFLDSVSSDAPIIDEVIERFDRYFDGEPGQFFGYSVAYSIQYRLPRAGLARHRSDSLWRSAELSVDCGPDRETEICSRRWQRGRARILLLFLDRAIVSSEATVN